MRDKESQSPIFAVSLPWLLLWPVLLVLALFLIFAPRFISEVDASGVQALFLNSEEVLKEFRPEPLEQLRYLLTVSVVPFVFTVLTWLFRRKAPKNSWKIFIAALITQLGIAIFLGWNFYRSLKQHAYLGGAEGSLGAAFCIAVLFGSFALLRVSEQAWFERVSRWYGHHIRLFSCFAIFLAMLVAVIWLLPSVYHAGNLGKSHMIVWFHVPYTLGEFTAFMNGRTPLVDFFPAYQILITYLIAPILQTIGIGILQYTLLMMILSFLLLIILYHVLCRVAGGRWLGFLIFFPLVAMACLPVLEIEPGFPVTAFNYYAVGPLRYLGPSLVALALVSYLSKSSRFRLFLVFFAGAFTSVNNLDFGFPAFAGAIAAVMLSGPLAEEFKIKKLIERGIVFLASVGISILGFYALTFARSGSLPDLSFYTLYQKIYILYGLYMLPAPRTGLHVVIYVAFMSAVLIPIWKAFQPSARGPRERMLLGMSAFSGVFGLGVLMYYVGRSHWLTLPAVFLAWSLCWGVLLCLVLHFARLKICTKEERALQTLPIAVLLLGYGYMVFAGVYSGPSVSAQIRRLLLYEQNPALESDPNRFPSEGHIQGLAKFVQSHASPGSRVAIYYPNSHWIAILAGVQNVFPFSNPNAVFLKSQVELLVKRVLETHTKTLFGKFPPELVSRLRELGFGFVAKQGEFEVWDHL
jgi:hypothetical protein